jgi:hypothetical protein
MLPNLPIPFCYNVNISRRTVALSVCAQILSSWIKAANYVAKRENTANSTVIYLGGGFCPLPSPLPVWPEVVRPLSAQSDQ